jgi:hypothetical protein
VIVTTGALVSHVPRRRVGKYVERLRKRLAIPLLGAMVREREQLRTAIASIQGLMPVLMKPRNGQSWTTEDRTQILAHLRRLSTVSPYFLVSLVPGHPSLLPLLAWWLDKRRHKRGKYNPNAVAQKDEP